MGLSSAEVESLVTIPLEEALAGVPQLEILRSKSVNQLSSILMIFERGTDVIDARRLVQERLAIASPLLPTWAAPPVIMPPLSSTARTIKILISSDEYSVMDLSMITYWTIRERLLRVPGVANVAIWGEQIEILQAQAELEQLAQYNVSMEEMVQVMSDSLDAGIIQHTRGQTIGKGGFVETPNQTLPIRHVFPVFTPEDMSNLVINDRVKPDGTPTGPGRCVQLAL